MPVKSSDDTLDDVDEVTVIEDGRNGFGTKCDAFVAKVMVTESDGRL